MVSRQAPPPYPLPPYPPFPPPHTQPFCPTTALDVCSADEHYEPGRPNVLATLIPQTDTKQMAFFAFSDFDNSTRLHYTVAARPDNVQVFTVSIALNGTSGALLAASPVALPAGLDASGITYVVTYAGTVYVAFATGALLAVNPATGAVTAQIQVAPASAGLTLTLGSGFDRTTGTFFANANGPSGGFYLVSYSIAANTSAVVGPLPAAPGTGGGGGARVDSAVASIPVYPPAGGGGGDGVRLLEMRTSPDAPFLFMAWLDPSTGVSTLLDQPSDWYEAFDIDPNIFPDQWPGSQRRVWSWDPVDLRFWAKMYDECGTQVSGGGGGAVVGGSTTTDCDENEAIVSLQPFASGEDFWYVFVEPVEPELTQMVWVWTDVVH